MTSKMKFAGLGAMAALAFAASPFALTAHQAFAAAPVAVAAASSFTPAQKTELEAMMKDYIMKNPQVLMDSVNNFKSDAQKAQEDDAAASLKSNSDYLLRGTLPDVGNKKADVTVVEFFDYNCGYCKQGYQAVQQSLDTDKNIRFVFVDYPILSDSSHLASRYALAAQKQNKYFELHREMMQFKGPKTDESILALAKTAGLNIDKLKADLNSPDIEKTIIKNGELATKLAISGTPAFIIGDQIIRGYVPYEAMKGMVAEQRKKPG